MKQRDTPDPEAVREAKRSAALAESTLKFRRALQDASDNLFVSMVSDNRATDAIKFTTPNGRNVMLVLAFGDDAVGQLTDAVNDLLDEDHT